MNTEKAERLREIANRFPTRRLEEKFFLLSLADEESKPLELDDSEIEKEAKRRGYSEYKSPDSAIAYSTFIESSEWYRSSIRGLRKEELESPLLAEQSYQIADAMLNGWLELQLQPDKNVYSVLVAERMLAAQPRTAEAAAVLARAKALAMARGIVDVLEGGK